MIQQSIREKIRSHIRRFLGRSVVDVSIMILLAEILLSGLLFYSGLPAGTDSLSWIAQTAFQGRNFRWLYAWRLFDLGFPQSSSLFDLLLISVHNLLGDPSVAVKLITLVSFCTAQFSMYSYVFYHTKRHNAALIAAVVYLLNQLVFAEFSEGHIALLFGYALAPLLFLLLDKACARGRIKDCLVLGLMFSILITGFHLECVYIYSWFMLLYFLMYIIAPNYRTKGRRDALKRIFKVWGIGISIAISMSSFFLMPIILDVRPAYLSPSYQYTIEEARGLADFFINQIGFHMLLLFFPISLATIALYRNRHTVFFTLSAFIAAFIAKGTLPPFPEVFEWLFVNVPYMHVFRATSRWFMMTWLSGAFLTGLLVAKSEETIRNILRNIKNKLPSPAIHKAKIFLGTLMTGIVLLNASFSGLQFFGSRLTYNLPEQDVISSQWIGSVPGDFRVATVGFSGLGSNWIPGPLGSGYREISSESYYLHDKAVVQNGGWEPLARSFIEFVHSSAYQRKIDDLLRILGLLDVKYVILSSNAPSEWSEIFYEQYGSRRVLDYSGSVVLENEFWNPRVFAVSRYAAVLGGRATLNSLSKVPDLDFAGCGLIYLDQNIDSLTSLVENADYLIISDGDVTDITMLLLEEDYVTRLEKYGYPSSNPEEHWIVGLAGIDYGKLTTGTLTTGGNNSITLPFEAKEEGEHEVWVRVCFGIGRGRLQLVVDNTTIGSVLSDASFPVSKFGWLSVGSIHLEKGEHTLALINHSPGYNDVDAVAIVPSLMMQQKMEEVSNLLQALHCRMILISEAEDLFGEIPALHEKGWNIHQSSFNASNGFVIQSSGRYENVAPEGDASASSIEGPGFEASNAIDGDGELGMTRWSSEFGVMPQWLQIEWEQPKDLWGLRIFFEAAYAEDYQVQIWDGENWINQKVVEGNAALDCSHIFSQPITTNKVRLYFTSAPEYNSVSIWEVEAYSTHLSKGVYVPKTGPYVLSLRLATGPNLGTIRFEIGNVSTTIQTGNPNATYYKWYEIGPIELNAGEESLNMSWIGDLYLDELILYSLKEGERALRLESLLQPSAIPIITQERINPGRYNARVSSDEPFLLVLADTYHPLWKAYVGNLEVTPVVAYSVVNGFFINKTGNFDIVISFTGQAYADLGWRMSAVTVLVLAVALATPSQVFKRLRRYMRRSTLEE